MELTIGGYSRKVLLRVGKLEVVLIIWPPGTRTPKHDHGLLAKGWVYMLMGCVFEIHDGVKDYHKARTSFREIPLSAHIVGNDSTRTSASLHFYWRLAMKTLEDSPEDTALMT